MTGVVTDGHVKWVTNAVLLIDLERRFVIFEVIHPPLKLMLMLTVWSTDANECQEGQSWDGQHFKWIKSFYHLQKIVLESNSNQLPLAIKTSYIELYGKPLWEPTFTCSVCLVVPCWLAVSRNLRLELLVEFEILWIKWTFELQTSYFWWSLVRNHELVLAR